MSELRKLTKLARRAGFVVTPFRRHDLWTSPDGHMETVGRTPGRRTISMLLRWIEEHRRRA